MSPTRTAERIIVPPRNDLARETPFALVRAVDEADGDGLTLDGYAAVFNRETIIDSWEGKFREKISPGAMKKSFREKPPRIQFDHGRHPLVGSIPIAQMRSISEDSDPTLAPDGGAHVIGRLLDNWLVQPVREAIASGAIDGMSFRFGVVREQWFDSTGKRITDEDELLAELRRTWYEDVPDEELLLRDLRELKVPELGPVVWPAYEETSVGVRSITVDLGSLDDPEQRKSLARAVFLADAAERMNDGDSSPATEQAGGHEPSTEPDEPRSTEQTSAGEHPSTAEPDLDPEPVDHSPAEPVRHSSYVDTGSDWYLPSPTSTPW